MPPNTQQVEEVLRFWRHVFGGERGRLQIWTGIRNEQGKIPKATIKSAYFNYPAAAVQAAQAAFEYSAEKGRETYFCAHLLKGPERQKANAADIHALWAEWDGGSAPNGRLTPTARLESSPGRYHGYLRLSKSIPPKEAEELNRRLAHATGADPSGADLTQLLRVPGTPNNKYPNRPIVRLEYINGAWAYSPAELDMLLPKLEEPKAEYEPEDTRAEPPVELSPEHLKVWRGEKSIAKDTGELDRSASLMKIGRVLYDAGANRKVVIEALKERDAALGWQCYTDRRDDREYERIFTKLCAAGRNPSFSGGNSENRENSENGVSGRKRRWEKPAPFYEYDLPDFPTDALPDWTRQFVVDEAKATQTPEALAGSLVLTAGALALAKLVVVEPTPGWVEPVNLYTATAMRPGERKSAVFKATVAPVGDFEKEWIKEAGADIAEQRTRYEIHEQRLQKFRQAAAKAKEGKFEGLLAQAQDYARELAEIDVPVEPQLIADDASPESITSLLAAQHGRIAILSAEGDVFDIMAGRYSQGVPNLGPFLKGHAGDEIRVNRIGRPDEKVSEPALTIGLAVQPDVLQGLVEKPGFRGRGLLGRFLYSLPHSNLGNRDQDPPPMPHETLAGYRINMKRLLKLTPKDAPSGEYRTMTMTLSDEAKKRLREFGAWLEPLLAENAELGTMTDWAGKLKGAAVRMAGILHAMVYVTDRPEPSLSELTARPISGDAMKRAIKLAHYYLSHARAAFAVMGSDPTVEGAKRLLRWIEGKGVTEISKRDLFQGVKGTFHKMSAMEPSLELLVQHGHLLREKEMPRKAGRGQNPSPIYEVNPLDAEKITLIRHSQNSQDSQNNEPEDEDLPTLYTSNWGSPTLPSQGCIPVGISRGRPWWKTGFEYKRLPLLWPSKELFEDWKAKKVSEDEFTRIYREHLDSVGVSRIVAELRKISSEHDNKPLFLLCYEKPGEFCHRRVFADWFYERTGIEIKEYEEPDEVTI